MWSIWGVVVLCAVIMLAILLMSIVCIGKRRIPDPKFVGYKINHNSYCSQELQCIIDGNQVIDNVGIFICKKYGVKCNGKVCRDERAGLGKDKDKRKELLDKNYCKNCSIKLTKKTPCPVECKKAKPEPTLREGLELANNLLGESLHKKLTKYECKYVWEIHHTVEYAHDVDVDRIVDLFHKVLAF